MEPGGNWEEEILKKIRGSKNLQTKFGEASGNQFGEFAPETEDFDTSFNNVYTLVVSTVSQLNNKLGAENINLQVVDGVDNPTSNRKAVQVVLKESNTPVNLLENPYLLIEGFANNGEVRIVSSGSTDQGKIMSVTNVDFNVLKSELSDFIKNSY